MICRVLVFFIVTLLSGSFGIRDIHALSLEVSGGQLIRASDVMVLGVMYDVSFEDGTCVLLYSGCDSISDFTFQDRISATSASQALLDQVLTDGTEHFDSQPYRTKGCSLFRRCSIFTPYRLLNFGNNIAISVALNELSDIRDNASGVLWFESTHRTNLEQAMTYAVWTKVDDITVPLNSVPEPSTMILLGTGLIGLVGFNYRRKKTGCINFRIFTSGRVIRKLNLTRREEIELKVCSKNALTSDCDQKSMRFMVFPVSFSNKIHP